MQTEEEMLSEDNQLSQGLQSSGESSSIENAFQTRDLQSLVKALQKENTRKCSMLAKVKHLFKIK